MKRAAAPPSPAKGKKPRVGNRVVIDLTLSSDDEEEQKDPPSADEENDIKQKLRGVEFGLALSNNSYHTACEDGMSLEDILKIFGVYCVELSDLSSEAVQAAVEDNMFSPLDPARWAEALCHKAYGEPTPHPVKVPYRPLRRTKELRELVWVKTTTSQNAAAVHQLCTKCPDLKEHLLCLLKLREGPVMDADGARVVYDKSKRGLTPMHVDKKEGVPRVQACLEASTGDDPDFRRLCVVPMDALTEDAVKELRALKDPSVDMRLKDLFMEFAIGGGGEGVRLLMWDSSRPHGEVGQIVSKKAMTVRLYMGVTYRPDLSKEQRAQLALAALWGIGPDSYTPSSLLVHDMKMQSPHVWRKGLEAPEDPVLKKFLSLKNYTATLVEEVGKKYDDEDGKKLFLSLFGL